MTSLTSHLLKQRADLYRKTSASDGQGGTTYSFSLVKANVKCKIDQASGSEQFEAQQAGGSMTHKIYLEHDLNVRRGDEIRHSGDAYRVDLVYAPSTPGVYRRADSELIQPEGVDF
ncbi:head-to-tail stopper [Streptomyces phage Yara]|nr:head-to-tail stopper [Streptomyces phage Yara]